MNYPESYLDKPLSEERKSSRPNTRLALRKMGESEETLFVFSFYPDAAYSEKGVEDPLQVAEFFGLDKDGLKAKIVFAREAEHQLRHISVCLSSLLYSGILLHDEW